MVGLPVLAVEVPSPSTRLIDLNLKRAAFERARVAAYWVVDPERPSVTAWQLDGEHYAEAVVVSGDRPLRTDVPFSVEVTPSRLVR